MSIRTIKNFPYKNAKVLVPLNLENILQKMDTKKIMLKRWIGLIKLKLMMKSQLQCSQPNIGASVGFGELENTNRSLWGSFLIEYKGKKIFFACDTGPAPFYKDLGEKFGPIDLGFGNIGAYNFFPIVNVKDKSTGHANPEELLSLNERLKS